jgi:hypothetical protein
MAEKRGKVMSGSSSEEWEMSLHTMEQNLATTLGVASLEKRVRGADMNRETHHRECALSFAVRLKYTLLK